MIWFFSLNIIQNVGLVQLPLIKKKKKRESAHYDISPEVMELSSPCITLNFEPNSGLSLKKLFFFLQLEYNVNYLTITFFIVTWSWWSIGSFTFLGLPEVHHLVLSDLRPGTTLSRCTGFLKKKKIDYAELLLYCRVARGNGEIKTMFDTHPVCAPYMTFYPEFNNSSAQNE